MSHGALVNDLAFSPDGQWLATASLDKTARVWEAATGRELARVTHEREVTHAAFSPDGKWLSSLGRDNVSRVWEAGTGREVPQISRMM